MKNLMKGLYCVTANYDLKKLGPNTVEFIEEKFNELLKNYLDESDFDFIAMCEYNKQAIYLLNIESFKVLKIVEFFSKHNLLISFECVSDNLFNFIHTNDNVYSNDELAKKIIDNYILENITTDNILDRINEIGYKNLLPIELSVLTRVSKLVRC